MDEHEMIARQQFEIENLKEQLEAHREVIRNLKGYLYGIGQPMNDNILQFNKRQLQWCLLVVNEIDKL